MPSFGLQSLKQIATVKMPLRNMLSEAITLVDISVICGRRSENDQERAYANGATTKHWPDSKHNVRCPEDLARAVDVYPYPRPIWTDDLLKKLTYSGTPRPEMLSAVRDWARWYYVAGLLRGIAHAQGTKLRQGCDWNGDGDFRDQTFDDIPHHELP